MVDLVIDTKPVYYPESWVPKIEEMYNARYLLETQLRLKRSWTDFPLLLFWQDVVEHPNGSNVFGIYTKGTDDSIMITNGLAAFEEPIEAIVVDGVVHYSHYRHDFRSVGDVAIDGGRDYIRLVGNNLRNVKRVQIILDNGFLRVIDEKNDALHP